MIVLSIIIIILSFALIIVGKLYYNLSNNHVQEVLINKERQSQNEQIEQQIQAREKELTQVQEQIHQSQELVSSLSKTAEELRQEALNQADGFYKTRLEEMKSRLAAEQDKILAGYNEESSALASEIKLNKQKLQDLEAKQLAYIKALKRQEKIDANQDYYRLVIDDLDLNDIELLREIQKRMVRKEPIDKVIYETYYRPAYNILMSHLFGDKEKICGIYKITDLTTNQAYIGQSVDIRERFKTHIKTSLSYGKSTNKLYQTMQSSGQNNFTFEILEEVPRDKLNEREIYWIKFYKTREMGLNSTRGGS